MSEPLVRIESLDYRYPGAESGCLHGVELEIEPGELIVVAGRSGSGKTTLLRACCGLVPHYHGGEVAGEVEVAGLDVRDHGPAALGGAVGMVAQDPETQVVSTTVRGEIELPLEMRGSSPAGRARAVEEVALALAIPQLLDRAVDTLSGGELQRVALAAALVGRPRLVLLDEPTSQLDPVAGDELIGLLRRLNEEWGMAVVLAEHRLERCLTAADRVVAMASGRIAFDGDPERFLEWALRSDGALATPAARLFDLAGLGSPPVGVKRARVALRRAGIDTPPARQRVAGGQWGWPRGAAAVRRSGARCSGPVGGARSGRRRQRRPARRRAGDRARRARRADGPQRSGQDDPAAGGRGGPPGRLAAELRRPTAARCWPRAPATCWSASGSTRSSPERPGVGRWPRSVSSGPPRLIRETSPAASASGWRWRS